MKRTINRIQEKLLDLLINYFNKQFPADTFLQPVPIRIEKPWDKR